MTFEPPFSRASLSPLSLFFYAFSNLLLTTVMYYYRDGLSLDFLSNENSSSKNWSVFPLVSTGNLGNVGS